MKKISLLLILALCLSFTGKAQDTLSFRKDLNSLIADAQNEFSINQGPLEYKDTVKNKQYFTPKINLGCTDFFIQQQKDAQGTYKAMICSYNLTDTKGLTNAIVYLPVILDELNKMNSSGKYKGRDYKDESGTDITELTDTEGNYIMELASTAQAVTLRLYSKSWGKR